MRSFLQYLKEEEQQSTLGGWWFRARNTLGGEGDDVNAGAPAVLGGFQNWGGYVKMLNMPQFFLDMYDYNGDGTIGDNDQELIFQIAELAFEIYEETGEFPPPMSAADYLENWEYYSELYGKDFPEPIGFIERPGGNSPVSDLSISIIVIKSQCLFIKFWIILLINLWHTNNSPLNT